MIIRRAKGALVLASALLLPTVACGGGTSDDAATGGAAQTGSAKGVFDLTEPATDLRLEVPFDKLIVPDQDGTGAKDGVEVDGTLTAPSLGLSQPLKLKVKTRGNTSLLKGECDSFPKLKFTLSEPPAGSAFAGNRAFKVATHCGELPPSERTKFGRVANEVAPWREAAVYQMLGALGLAVPRTRPVTITYVDTSAGNKELLRKAALIEDVGDVAKRLGGKEIFVVDSDAAASDPRAAGSAETAKMDPVEIALVHLGEALVGNEDFRLLREPETWLLGPDSPEAQSFFWNMKAIALPDGKERPVPVDFDLAMIVAPLTGKAFFPDTFKGDDAQGANLQGQYEVLMGGRTRSERSVLDQALARVRAPETRAAIQQVVSASWLDDEGRAAASKLFASFVDTTGADDRYYGEVVTQSGFDILREDGTSDDTCLTNEIPIGSPIHRWGVTNDKLGLEQVSIMDVRFQMPCDHPRVWVKKGLASATDFPKASK
jgi:hypothetical protein